MIAVAVLMSVYERDDPAMLEVALRSVLEQKLPNDIESRVYLGVDGYIGPDLREVIDRFEQSIYYFHKKDKNGGLAAMLNELISITNGEKYLLRMDSDDKSLPQRFIRQIEYLEHNSQIDILGTAIIERDLGTGRSRIVRFARDPSSARRDIAKRPPLAHPTACFRRRVFETVGGYPMVPFSEDVALWFKCLEAGMSFDNLSEPLYEFTISENFWKRRGLQKAWKEYRTWSKGVYRLEGITWRQIYPLARLLMRVGPKKVQQILYSNFLRRVTAIDPS